MGLNVPLFYGGFSLYDFAGGGESLLKQAWAERSFSRERNDCFSPFGATKFQFVMGFNGYYINRMFSTCERHFGPTSISIKYDLYLKAQRSQASLVLRQFWRLWLLQAAYIYYTFRFSYFRISLPNECLSWWGGPAMVHDLLIVKLPFMALNFQTKTNSRNWH